MKVIHKHVLAGTEWQGIDLPEEVQFLSLQVHNDVPCLWIMRDTDSVPQPRVIRRFYTGDEFPNIPMQYLGTVYISRGRLVMHYFIETRTFTHARPK